VQDNTGGADAWLMLGLGVIGVAGCVLWSRRIWRLRRDRSAADSLGDCAVVVLVFFIVGAFPVISGVEGLVGAEAPQPVRDAFVWSMVAMLFAAVGCWAGFELRDAVVARRRDRALGRPRGEWLLPAWAVGVVWGTAAMVMFPATVYLLFYAFAWYALTYTPTVVMMDEFNALAMPVVLIPAGLVWLTIAALGVRSVMRRRRRIRQRDEDLRRRWLDGPDPAGEA
jgi:hypothetical protein